MMEISKMEGAVAKLTADVDRAKSSARGFEIGNMINQQLGQYNSFGSLFAGLSREDADEKREIRESYQRRRDTLLQQYHYKECQGTSTDSPVKLSSLER
jgi:hypothetical protein